jgi:ADP-ribosylglycohydrolase
MNNSSHQERLERATHSLEGLSVGDALGDRYFLNSASALTAPDLIASHMLPSPPWYYTDDTEMALSIFSILRQHATIEQDLLAESFAQYYDGSRGYGPAMHGLLRQIGDGQHWKVATQQLFSGQGSFGNGAAMRVAPLGAYFADSLDLVVKQAERSAEITHAHPEGIAGAIAVAVAAAWAWQLRDSTGTPTCAEFLDLVLPSLPDSEVRTKIRRARNFSDRMSVEGAISILGNGSGLSAQDTVPFVLWCAGQHLTSYEEAIWFTLSGLGDIDTNCAMVGGIVVLYSGRESIPADWLQAREPLPDWAFNLER